MPRKPSSNSDLVYLWHIVHACEQLESYIQGVSFEEFCSDHMLRDAVYWRISVIGEAVGNLSDELIEQHHQIQWHKARSARNRIVHGYDSIKDNIIWEIATVHLPEMHTMITPLIPAPPED